VSYLWLRKLLIIAIIKYLVTVLLYSRWMILCEQPVLNESTVIGHRCCIWAYCSVCYSPWLDLRFLCSVWSFSKGGCMCSSCAQFARMLQTQGTSLGLSSSLQRVQASDQSNLSRGTLIHQPHRRTTTTSSHFHQYDKQPQSPSAASPVTR